MMFRSLGILTVVSLAIGVAGVRADGSVGPTATVAPYSATYGPPYVVPYPAYMSPGMYSPWPGIVAPVPYPNWNYPPHWIYSYMLRPDDGYDRSRRTDEYQGKTYRGRDTLAPAVPYADYLQSQKDLFKSRQAPAKPAPTADKALLEIRMPNERAKLYFDGTEAAGEGDFRVFHTPALKSGQNYSFTIRATWPGLIDDMVSEQVVTFQAGEHKVVDLRPKN